VRSEHLFLDCGSNEGAEVASIRLPPEICFVRESNGSDPGVFTPSQPDRFLFEEKGLLRRFWSWLF